MTIAAIDNIDTHSDPDAYFFEELTFIDSSFQHQSDYFDSIFLSLKNRGYVRDSFLPAIKQREKLYPTALPTHPYVVALPHTDTEHVIRPFICVTRLYHEITWHEMANDDNELKAKFIFLLGFIDKDHHITLLQTLMECLSDEHFIEEMNQAPTPASLVKLLKSAITINNKENVK
ncbi:MULTISPECIES: PTS sugar transporter subunit IIA [Hafnia]|uniref:PTS sugar transporter subunit IIA n=1 Tax=Hafnia TaxID=568 RepID=UPI0008A64828|nr:MULTISPECIES: PTS sugar transporter subunit IIA [Hafnia]MCE9921389.1 PTS sugar transporter subunit IIA [Hafnia paralvei]OFS12748.1 hypothetical protein HMPREF3091_00825 [Hafnia sp. HMSC23F03]